MNKNWNKERHQRIYLALSVLIFALVGLGHLCIALRGWAIEVGFITFPLHISWLAFFIALCMVVMGGYYALHKN